MEEKEEIKTVRQEIGAYVAAAALNVIENECCVLFRDAAFATLFNALFKRVWFFMKTPCENADVIDTYVTVVYKEKENK